MSILCILTLRPHLNPSKHYFCFALSAVKLSNSQSQLIHSKSNQSWRGNPRHYYLFEGTILPLICFINKSKIFAFKRNSSLFGHYLAIKKYHWASFQIAWLEFFAPEASLTQRSHYSLVTLMSGHGQHGGSHSQGVPVLTHVHTQLPPLHLACLCTWTVLSTYGLLP